MTGSCWSDVNQPHSKTYVLSLHEKFTESDTNGVPNTGPFDRTWTLPNTTTITRSLSNT